MNSPLGHRKYLVTGASGYVGGRLVRALIDDKDDVRILVRDKNKIMGQPWATQVEICEGSAENYSDLQLALEGVHTAFYLLHSINLGPHFDEIESEMPETLLKLQNKPEFRKLFIWVESQMMQTLVSIWHPVK